MSSPVIPSKRKSRRVPFMPTVEQDIAQQSLITQPHRPGNAPGERGYVISTFDARPLMARDFQTQSGTDARDVGWLPAANQDTASAFYTVPNGYQAVLRDYHILTVPQFGQEPGPIQGPVFSALGGASQFKGTISILVDGVHQLGVSGVVTWAAGFGDVFGDCYVLAQGGSTIEVRFACDPDNLSEFYQCLINMHGNLLLSQSSQLEYAPTSTDVIPVEPISREGV